MTVPSASNFSFGNQFQPGFVKNLIPQIVTTTTFTIFTGSALDSTGSSNVTVDSSLTVNTAVSGAGGLDTGALAASTAYAVHVIWNSLDRSIAPVGLMSLSDTAPNLPAGYDSFYRSGWVFTDGSSLLRAVYAYGQDEKVIYTFDTPVSVLAAGVATSQTAVSLAAVVPPINKITVKIASSYSAAAAGRLLTLYPSGSTGTSQTIVTGQIAGVITQRDDVTAQIVSGVAKIDYKTSNADSAATLYVVGFIDRR